MELLDRFFSGDIRALSRLITQVENRREGFRKLLGDLSKKTGRAIKIGVTGPPGAGKSTLVYCLTSLLSGAGTKVGIVAVDPSSPFTGGALLGDRVRMGELPSDGRVYFRSMASRGATGGLSSATDNVSMVLDAFGFDIILIETVGVGQVELDIVDACDTVVVVVVPESGDAVQTMKAGLMEVADIMVVNKADRQGAESLAVELKHALHLRTSTQDAWETKVVTTQANQSIGIEKLHQRIREHLEFIKANDHFDRHRRLQVQKKILAILSHRFRREFIDRLAEQVDFDQIVDDVYRGRSDPYLVADELYQTYARSHPS
ncbi:MAG: methylmalonyl Co-A mutase-associated GTPase MeaB [candidate division Zixibacteria bacterium]|nr:methylmalonyl Co-A mutase-associated GTPase MeaB [candidate division Zixibacteria bacterium]MDH3936967.1 methylmalonyl Co-A mutase-associated GTPase MeaB [candidate division Zixibacteria bacterium]MDH4035014.1 methylmalonyl Co-A mutase-associated GTPase MeaB [candidate division Zixibacteria bacterium]